MKRILKPTCFILLICILLPTLLLSCKNENEESKITIGTSDNETLYNTESTYKESQSLEYTSIETIDCTTLDTESETENTSEHSSNTETESVSESESESESISETTKYESTTVSDIENSEKKELPRIDINTENGQSIVSKDYYINAEISVSRCDKEYIRENLPSEIRARGNSTFAAAKKPFRIKFKNKQSLLGLNSGRHFKSWCLMADYYDASMLRTYATFCMAKILLEGKYYSSDCTPVEVYINGEYNGVYLLCEQTQINVGRVNIYEKKDDETSLDIGYLMIGQGGRTDEDETVIIPVNTTVYDRNGSSMTFNNMNFALSGGEYTEAQKEYVKNYVSGVFKVISNALYNEKYYTLSRDGTLKEKTEFKGNSKSEKQIETIDAVFNIESAVSLCILDEIVKNLDAMTFNMYVDLSADGDGRLTLAAPWDFDFAMANTHYSTTHSYRGFYATNLSYSEGMRTNLFYVMFGSIDWFEDMVKDLWQEKYEYLKDVAYSTLLNSYIYSENYNRDWAKWGKACDRSLIHHHDKDDLTSFNTHLDSGIFLYNWLTNRLAWLNQKWGDGDIVYNAEDIMIDMSNDSMKDIFTSPHDAILSFENNIINIRHESGHDPYFSIDFKNYGYELYAEDYRYLEIKMKIPKTNSKETYTSELFLCAGGTKNPTAGVSLHFTSKRSDDYIVYKIDLSKSPYWQGLIHKIRFDHFSMCDKNDIAYIEYIKLTSK